MPDFYVASADPAESSDVDSSVIRAEFTAIAGAFAKVAGYTGNASKAVINNAGGTGQTVTTGTLALAGNFATSGTSALTLTTTGATDVTLPLTGVLATLAGAETFTNKTINGAALAGTLSGTPTFSGNLTFSGSITCTSGSITSGLLTGSTSLILGVASPSANSSGTLQFLTSNSVKNWQVSSNQITSEAFEITPSTAGGGSTFSTALFKLTTSALNLKANLHFQKGSAVQIGNTDTQDMVLITDNTTRLTIGSGGISTFAGELRCGNAVNAVSPTAPNRTINLVIGGTTYYLHAKTTND